MLQAVTGETTSHSVLITNEEFYICNNIIIKINVLLQLYILKYLICFRI